MKGRIGDQDSNKYQIEKNEDESSARNDDETVVITTLRRSDIAIGHMRSSPEGEPILAHLHRYSSLMCLSAHIVPRALYLNEN